MLLVLGLLAALSAAVLVHSLRAERARVRHRQMARIICAAKALPAMTIIDASCVVAKTVRKDEAPPDTFSDSSHVIGKVLVVPMVQGEAFTKHHLASEDSGRQLASALADGMRAVTIHLADDHSLGGILYPGNIVDVLATFEVPSHRGSEKDMVAAVLAEKVQVLAIEEETVAASPRSASGMPPAQRRGPRMVTLMVNVDTAQTLRLAESCGRLLLILRNPGDSAPIEQLAAHLSSLYQDHMPARPEVVEPDEPPAPRPQWPVDVIRGEDRATHVFQMDVAPRGAANK